MPKRLWVELESGKVVECMTTEEAAQWIGVAKTTLSRGAYRTALESVLRGRQRWWPVDKVMAHVQRKFDRRYKEAKEGMNNQHLFDDLLDIPIILHSVEFNRVTFNLQLVFEILAHTGPIVQWVDGFRTPSNIMKEYPAALCPIEVSAAIFNDATRPLEWFIDGKDSAGHYNADKFREVLAQQKAAYSHMRYTIATMIYDQWLNFAMGDNNES